MMMRIAIVTVLACSLAVSAFEGKTMPSSSIMKKMKPARSFKLYSTPAENIGEAGEGDIVAAAEVSSNCKEKNIAKTSRPYWRIFQVFVHKINCRLHFTLCQY